MESPGRLRIGELSTRTGVSPELLRAWERRYALLRPERSAGGFRLYSPDDESRVRRMLGHIDAGLAAAEAARLAIGDAGQPASEAGHALAPEQQAAELADALERFDDDGAQAVLDRLFSSYGLDTVMAQVVLPYLQDLGARWHDGTVSVAQEHFASNLLRSRLLHLGRGWDAGFGPRALLACPEGDLHDIALICFGLALHRRGWRITFLGANTPGSTLSSAAQRVRPDAVVVSASRPGPIEAIADALRDVAARWPLRLGGPGSSAQVAADVGAELLPPDVVAAAEALAGGLPSQGGQQGWPGGAAGR